jgi:SynChlorMet cassette radical SAM/SPASM protein ScmF
MPTDIKQTEYPLHNLYFYLTEGCNLKCRHCWIAPEYQAPEKPVPALDTAVFRDIIEEAKPLGLQCVKLTGGEPLLHPEIEKILEIITAEELRLTMETNGVLCTPEMASLLRASGKKPFVSVSIDGSEAETHEWVRGVEGCFEAAIDGIRNLVNVGFKPQIIMTVMRRNRDQMEPLVRLAESLGAGSVKFNIVQPTARGEKMHEANETLSIEELIETGRWAEVTLSNSTDLRVVFHHPPAFKPLGNMLGENGNGCGRCSILRVLGVLSDGSYAMCGIGEAIPELIFGRAGKDRLKDVWQDNSLLQELRAGMPDRLKGTCGECVMKEFCLGNCMAQNYYTNRDLWSPFWYCEEARSKGLFPESRLKV